MSEFKKGDRVKCIDTGDWQCCLTIGKVYVVTSVCRSYLRIDDDAGSLDSGFAAHRFELVTDERQALSDAIDLCNSYELGISSERIGQVWVGKVYGTMSKGEQLDELFPPSPTAQELEMEREVTHIEKEMRALADILAKLKS